MCTTRKTTLRFRWSTAVQKLSLSTPRTSPFLETLAYKASEIKALFKTIAVAIKYCHDMRISHCDIKFDNILINHSKEVKIIDFGFAVKRNSKHTLISHYCGTPAFMCPEIVRRVPYDPHKADIWALGILLYKLVMGFYPFSSPTDHQLNTSILHGKIHYNQFVSNCIRDVIDGMLHKDEKMRYTLDQVLQNEWLKTL